jgi:hypothetical protein
MHACTLYSGTQNEGFGISDEIVFGQWTLDKLLRCSKIISALSYFGSSTSNFMGFPMKEAFLKLSK